MTPTADLMKLVEKWRKDAETPDLIAWTTRHSLRRCADELEAALTASCDARVGGDEYCEKCGTTPCRRGTVHALATPAQPKASEETEQDDVPVWELIRIAESCGAVKDEGEDGIFWTLTLDAFFALEAKMRDAVNAMRFAEADDHPKASEGKAGGEDAAIGILCEVMALLRYDGDLRGRDLSNRIEQAVNLIRAATLTAPGADDGQ